MYFENLWHEQLKIIICASRNIGHIQFHRYVWGYQSYIQFHKYVEGYKSFITFGKHWKPPPVTLSNASERSLWSAIAARLQEIGAPGCKNSRVNAYRSHIWETGSQNWKTQQSKE